MFPEPLHPAIVHFPIVLVIALPLVTIGVLWRMHDGAPLRTWGLVVVLAVLLWGFAWAASWSGHREHERVEEILASDEPVEEHEEAGENVVLITGIVAGLAVLGFLPRVAGRSARWLTLLGAVVALAAGVRTSYLGGELVYRHGAAAAYADSTAVSVAPAEAEPASEPEDDEHEH